MAEEECKEVLPFNSSTDKILSGSDLVVPRDAGISQQLVDPRSVYKHYSPYDLISLAQEVQHADHFVQATTSGKLQVIVDQIRHLQQQAQQVLQSAKQDTQLHHAACNFVKVPGKTYHLYEKKDGTTFFSMLSPQEWGGKPPNTFLGSYRMEYDRSWTPAEEVEERERDIVAIQKTILAAVPAINCIDPTRMENSEKTRKIVDI